MPKSGHFHCFSLFLVADSGKIWKCPDFGWCLKNPKQSHKRLIFFKSHKFFSTLPHFNCTEDFFIHNFHYQRYFFLLHKIQFTFAEFFFLVLFYSKEFTRLVTQTLLCKYLINNFSEKFTSELVSMRTQIEFTKNYFLVI